MIIFDGTHLTSTTSADELHEFAQRVGLKREWYQDTDKSGQPSRHPHYDILAKRLKNIAAGRGAVMVTSQQLLRMAWWSEYKQRQVGK